MYKVLLLTIMTLLITSCKDRNRTAPVQDISKNIKIPTSPNSVTIEGKQKEALMEFLRVHSKLAKELTEYWKQYTEKGTSCNFNLGLQDNGAIRMAKPIKCDNSGAFNQMMSEISVTTLTAEELKILPSGIRMSIHNKE